jgi:hypothetical protein
MNATIGLCKKNVGWVSPLADLGYEPQIIEQSLNTSSGSVVKPDLIATSNRHLHSLVFELKGGKTCSADQLQRYAALTVGDLLRWVTVYDRNHLAFDVCLCDLASNHSEIKKANNGLFPMLIFSSDKLVKEGVFKRQKLNEAFKTPISLNRKYPPLSYYPFSDEDSHSYIAIQVVQALLSIIIKNMQQGIQYNEETIFTLDEIVANQFSDVWKLFSIEHRKSLRSKIIEAAKTFLAKQEVRDSLGIIQQKEGFKITKNLEQFKKVAEKYIEETQVQAPLSTFFPVS